MTDNFRGEVIPSEISFCNHRSVYQKDSLWVITGAIIHLLVYCVPQTPLAVDQASPRIISYMHTAAHLFRDYQLAH